MLHSISKVWCLWELLQNASLTKMRNETTMFSRLEFQGDLEKFANYSVYVWKKEIHKICSKLREKHKKRWNREKMKAEITPSLLSSEILSFLTIKCDERKERKYSYGTDFCKASMDAFEARWSGSCLKKSML